MQNKQLFCTAVSFLLVLLMSAFVNHALAASSDYEAARHAWPMIDSGTLLIDVRTKEEFDAGHVDGAINIPYDDTEALVKAIGDDHTRSVVVYCRSGNRAGKAKIKLESKGYTGIYNATGLEALKATRP